MRDAGAATAEAARWRRRSRWRDFVGFVVVAIGRRFGGRWQRIHTEDFFDVFDCFDETRAIIKIGKPTGKAV